MTIAAVQHTHVTSGTAASVVIALSPTDAGDTLFALCSSPASVNVQSITDNIRGRWIQAAYASSPTAGNVELWLSRGIQGGGASVTVNLTGAQATINVAEFSGCWFQSPLDTWSQNFGTGSFVTPQQVSPRENGELVFTVARSTASVSTASGGFTSLSLTGNGNAAGYDILSGSVVPVTGYSTASSVASWAILEAAFMPGPTITIPGSGGSSSLDYRNTTAYRNTVEYQGGTGGGGASVIPIVQLNPLLQFPETMVQIGTQQNYLAPLQGIGIWVDVSSYLESMTLGPIGRQHELDRVQSSAAQFTFNGRDGTFNPWNNLSFLWPGGLDPMTPIKVTAAYHGTTSAIYYGYCQSFDPTIIDSQNVDVVVSAYDILQMLSLSYLSNNSYAQAVLAGN